MPSNHAEVQAMRGQQKLAKNQALSGSRRISVVMPLHNEADAFPKTLRLLIEALKQCTTTYEILAIDDGSTDKTWDVLIALTRNQETHGTLKAIRFTRNFGKESAIAAGLSHATGEAIIIMDADGQHPPDLIVEMHALWRQGRFQIIEAVKRRRQNEPLARRLFARLFYRTLIVGADLDLRNSTDFKLLDRRAVSAYLALPEHGRFFRGLTAWMGLQTARLEIEPPPRTEGTTSWRLAHLFSFARRTIVSFTALPLRIISWSGFLGFLFSILLALQTLWNTLVGSAKAGFPTVILLILGIGSLILISLGLIGEYVSEIYNELKRRPLYIVRESVTSGDESTSTRPDA